MLASLAPCIQPLGSLLKTPGWQSQYEKMSAKRQFGKFPSMEKYTPLLLIERIQSNQKFNIE
jgi:hypothetical protein